MMGAAVGQGAPRFKGFPLELDGAAYTVPAMNAGTVEDFEDRIKALQTGMLDSSPVSLVTDLVHRSLLRNYPTLPREVVRDHVDMDNWAELFSMVMGQSGYKQWAEAAAAEGNERAQQILTANWPARTTGTGAPSLPTSPPAPAGPSSTAAST
jgi:hypothetical protein